HGCVTAWLILLIIVNSGVALLYLFGSEIIARNLPEEIPTSMLYLLGFASVLNVVCAILLFQWKRWGFYGFIITGLAGVIINISIGLSPGSSLGGLLGIAALFGILQIKQDGVSAWDNME
ncbi:MAG TPA: hypothetical protein VFJ43_11995, partial [Bacteroidia bacterium]|nr:hypothetical protein [Bacteroidia bacterium]